MEMNQTDFLKGEPSNNHAFQVLWRINALHEAKARRDWETYWENFHSCALIISPYLSQSHREKLQIEYNKLTHVIKIIEKTEPNEKTRERKISKLRQSFAYTHEIYIIHALSNLDIIKKQVDGEIDFNEIDIRTLEKLIRSSRSIPDMDRKLKTETEEQEEREEEPVPETEEDKPAEVGY